jgi:hypothetical protein
MALQLTLSDPFDVTSLTAYAKVSELNLNFDTQSGRLVVNVYASATARAVGRPAVTQRAYDVTPSGDNGTLSFAAMYAAAKTLTTDPAGTLAYNIVRRVLYQTLKTLPEFSGAADV